MDTVRDQAALRRAVGAWKARGERIALVPTMGALHAGHLALVGRARELAQRVVASVFVNPTQFGPGEDLARYPRREARDAELLARAGCDLLFLPAVETIYPPGHSTFVVVEGPAQGLEGELRPGHFRGVATVVTQLLNLVGPDLAVFGEKDAQQLAVVRRLVRDLHLPVEIVGFPTVREADGLALSSRNAFLTPAERQRATALWRGLEAAESAIVAGERDAGRIEAMVRAVIAAEPGVELQYAALVDADGFVPVRELADGVYVLAVAARVGSTRLIDNLRFTVAAGVPTSRAAAVTA